MLGGYSQNNYFEARYNQISALSNAKTSASACFQIGLVVALIWFVGFLVITVNSKQESDLSLYTKETVGTFVDMSIQEVEEYDSEEGWETRTYYYGIYQYEVNGETYKGVTRYPLKNVLFFRFFKKDYNTKVYYKSENPSDYVLQIDLNYSRKLHIYDIGFGLLALIFFINGFRLKIKAKKLQEILDNQSRAQLYRNNMYNQNNPFGSYNQNNQYNSYNQNNQYNSYNQNNQYNSYNQNNQNNQYNSYNSNNPNNPFG